MSDTFDSLRPRIIDYLYDRGIDPRKRFHCLNPSHLDRDPSMGFDPKRNKVHCFACGADYDLFDLLAIDNNLSSPADALSLASERVRRRLRKALRLLQHHRTFPHNEPSRGAGRSSRGGGGRIWGLRPVFFQRRTSFFLLSFGLLRPPGRNPLLHPAGPVGGHRHPLPLRLRSQA